MNNIYDYREAELTIFGLYGVDNKGNCECGNHECKALFKHPRASNWQATPFYSDEQIQVMLDVGHLATGFGVLVKNIIVVDVDECVPAIEPSNNSRSISLIIVIRD